MPPLLLASRVRSLYLLRSCIAQHSRHLSAARCCSFCPTQICSQRRRTHVAAAARSDPESTSPPLPSSSPSTRKRRLELPLPPPPTSAYVHLPFCVKKCFYCDFPVRALGEAGAQSLLPKKNGGKRGGGGGGAGGGGGGGGGGGRRSLPEGVASYLDTLLAEIAATSPAAAPSPPRPLPPLKTISFGGGTPSLLPPAEIARLVSALAERFGGLARGAEVSLEADPGTFDAASLAGYVEAGVTRLSVGVQSFDEAVLRGCGRSHGTEDVERALEVAATARRRGTEAGAKGLQSWSLDLVAGLPGLDLATWRETLRRAVAAGPDHVSVYDLQLEAGTPFGDAAARLESAAKRSKEKGAAEAAAVEERSGKPLFTLPGPLPKEDDAAEMLREASRVLGAAGYTRYEVSNYSKPERRRRSEEGEAGAGGEKEEEEAASESHESRHNGVYWRGDEDYYAFGLGASSRLRGVRVTRPRSMRDYSGFVDELARRGDGVPREEDGNPKKSSAASPAEASSSAAASAAAAAAAAAAPAAVAASLSPTARDVLLEVAMLRLRTREGLDLREVAGRWGQREARAIREALAPSVAAGLAAEEEKEPSSSTSPPSPSPWPVVRLTDPEGFLVSNSVISDVFVGLDGVAEE